MITIDASGASAGIDFEAFIRGGFIAGTSGGGFPVFDNGPSFSGEELFIGYGDEPTSKYVFIHGTVAYYFPTHTVWGTGNTIEYGLRGSGSHDADGYFTGGDVELRITGLEFHNAQPTTPEEEAEIEASGPIHNFSVAHMYGANGDPDRLDAYAAALDTYAQHFIGSSYDDVYAGTTFHDIIEGGGGNDRLSGGGGSDEIDGGEGDDTVVFDGSSTDYTITKSEAGIVTVQSGAGETSAVQSSAGKTTVANAEHLEFEDKTVAVADLVADKPKGKITVDARGANGIDLTSYLATYFAGVETNGTSSFHGGTEDAPYGYLNGDQVSFKYREAGDTTGPFVEVALLEGEEIAYDAIHYPDGGYPHGSISGTIDKLVFGTIDGAEPESGSDLYSDYLAELIISGLAIHDDPGAGGSSSSSLVPTLYYGVYGGVAGDIEAILAEYAQHFLGSGGGDTYVGSRFDDAARGRRGADDLSGGDGADILRGGRGKDGIAGDLGNDKLLGGRGKDELTGGSGDDVLKGGKARDTLVGDVGNDKLNGGRGNDSLEGGAGDDFLIGGRGRDKLEGADGADTFVFKSAAHSGAGSGRDVVRDFERSEGDLIDLSRLGDLDFIGNKAFSGNGGETRVEDRGAATLVLVDLDGNGKTDFGLKIVTSTGLLESDFIL